MAVDAEVGVEFDQNLLLTHDCFDAVGTQNADSVFLKDLAFTGLGSVQPIENLVVA
jgi:hypothetical protein